MSDKLPRDTKAWPFETLHEYINPEFLLNNCNNPDTQKLVARWDKLVDQAKANGLKLKKQNWNFATSSGVTKVFLIWEFERPDGSTLKGKSRLMEEKSHA